MIQLTKRLVMKTDRHCYIVGEARQRAGRAVQIEAPRYYSTAAQAVQGALDTAMRMAVEDEEVTTLREFIKEQERQRAALEKLIMPLEGGKPRQSVVEGRLTAAPSTDTPQPADNENPVIVRWDDHTGQRHERAFDNREDAELEAAALEEKFDYVAIILETEV